MLNIKNISKSYSTKTGHRVNALSELNLNFNDKGLVFILGKSGSGKTTLLNIIGGLDTPDCGELIIDGRSFKNFTSNDFDSYRNTCVGFVFQEYNLFESKSIFENISIVLEMQGKSLDEHNRNKIETLLKLLGLTDKNGNPLTDRCVNELSGGQKQRVAIARALIKDPKIILADEPTGALDSENSKVFYEMLKLFSKDRLIIVVTHDTESAQYYGDRIIELVDGTIKSDLNDLISQNIISVNKIELIPSKLPFKRIIKMSVGALCIKRFRLTISMILAIITFFIFGFSITAAFVNENTTIVKQMYQNNYNMVILSSASTETVDVKQEDGSIITHVYPRPLYERQIKLITDYNNGLKPMLSNDSMYENTNFFSISDYLYDDVLKNSYNILGTDSHALAELDSVTGTDDANLKVDARFKDKNLCRLPRTYKEIAITDLKADMFIRYGYKSELGERIEIVTPDDLIGKTLGEFTIVGVYSTEIELDLIRKLYLYENNYDLKYLNNLRSGLRGSMIDYCFVKKGFFIDHISDYEIYSVMLKLSGNYNKDIKLLNELYCDDGNILQDVYVKTMYSRVVSLALGYNYIIVPAGIICSVIFGVISVLLIMFFLNVSFDSKQRAFGILRALGAKKKDIAAIGIMEILIITAIDFIVSVIAITVICAVLNFKCHVPVFNFGIVQVLLVALLCLCVSLISSIIPLFKLVNKKPVDIINNI